MLYSPSGEASKPHTGGHLAVGAAMTGDEGREVCEARWPPEESDHRCEPCGVIERQRQLNLGRSCGRG
jgi:hypothetical protein